MNKMYDLLSKCQSQLKECRFYKVDAIELEMYFLHLKKLILYDMKTWDRHRIETCRTDIDKLYYKICTLCSPKNKFTVVKKYDVLVETLAEVLKKMRMQ